jgi:hypothetical protein
MTELSNLDIDAFNVVIHTIKTNHDHYKEIMRENIRLLYKILRKNGYTKVGTIFLIHESLKSTNITTEEIEKIIGEVKK